MTRVVSSIARLTDTDLVANAGEEGVLLQLPARLHSENEAGFEVTLDLALAPEAQHQVVVERFEVKRRPDGQGVTALGVRAIPIGELVDEVLTSPAVAKRIRLRSGREPFGGERWQDDWEVVEGPPHPAALRQALLSVRGRTGRPVNEEERLAELEAVAAAARAAPPRGVTAAVAALGYHPTTARRKIAEARAEGLLEHTARSRAAAKEGSG